MSHLFCERKTKWIGLAFWLLFWAVLVGTMLHSCSKPKVSAAKLEMSRRERMADLEVKIWEEQYESMSVEEKMKGIVYER
ncbi:hypothetical protein I7N24_03215 [Neisseria meningitidis]|uniref:hypothetical protein n=1 Tax=Neisseria meningitidis TaxID=487 RepID=UPI00032EE0CF|nr:hypothetical protein [Neisseria meningitidis]EOC34703.1 hypothetical protein NM2004032_0941 [Neisseria meningitidis 2004032]EPF56875.1 hypothetical protein NM2007461_0984 [Neisseria meningitidis 2007461]MBH2181602.1 hypothetical protein [Neisseria meningitidis]MBH2224436.1 hypothetical protein [Neisseria meningitidis]MBH2237592.1 hypothetical protein [Neisseria meningitidis]